MALSLVESAQLSQNKLAVGVAEELIRVSPLLGWYPFQEIVGNALAINREDEADMGSTHFRGVNEVWTTSEAGFDQVTFSLYTLGEDCDVPNLIQKTRSNINDQMAVQMAIKSKLMAYHWEDQTFYGTEFSAAGFSGLHSLCTTGQTIDLGTGTTGAALTTEAMDRLYDLIKGGKPDIFVMNLQLRRRISQYLRTVGSYTTERDQYGNYWVMWNEVPIIATEHIVQTELLAGGTYSAMTGGTGTGATSSVFAIRFGEGDGVCGIQNGGITTEFWDRLETKDSMRTRIKWYVGQSLWSTKALARITGARDMAITA